MGLTGSVKEQAARTQRLVAASTARREAIVGALAPLRAPVRRIDRAVHWTRARACWLGVAAGLGVGLLSKLRPHVVFAVVNVLARSLPLWRARIRKPR